MISCIKKSKKTRIIEVCHGPFLIGKIYNSDVVYNAIDIDAYHLLLGRI